MSRFDPDLIDEVIDECFEDYPDPFEDDYGKYGGPLDEPVTIEQRRAMGDDMLYPTYNIFGEWE